MIQLEAVQPRPVRGMAGTIEQARGGQPVERLRHLVDAVAQAGSELFGGQERAGMPLEKKQKIEVAGVAETGQAPERYRWIRHAAALPGGAIRDCRSRQAWHFHLPVAVSSFNATSNVSTG